MKSTFIQGNGVDLNAENFGKDFDSGGEIFITGHVDTPATLGEILEVKSLQIPVILSVLSGEFNIPLGYTTTFKGTTQIGEETFKFVLVDEGISGWMIDIGPISEISEKPIAIISPALIDIKPEDIVIPESGAVGNFDKREVEVAAGAMIAFFHETGSLWTFTKPEFEAFAVQNHFTATKVLQYLDEYIFEVSEGNFAITEGFIRKCAVK